MIRYYKENPNFKDVFQAVKENDGFCPCKVIKNKDTKCMCKDFRSQEEGVCHCGLYIKIKKRS